MNPTIKRYIPLGPHVQGIKAIVFCENSFYREGFDRSLNKFTADLKMENSVLSIADGTKPEHISGCF